MIALCLIFDHTDRYVPLQIHDQAYVGTLYKDLTRAGCFLSISFKSFTLHLKNASGASSAQPLLHMELSWHGRNYK